MSILELNLDHTGLGLGITTKQPAMRVNGVYQGESGVSSGKHFQEHRYNMQPAYVLNCVRDNSGLQSVHFAPQDTKIMGGTCKIGYIPCCGECNVTPFLHQGISFIHRNKAFLFTENHELYMVGCGMSMTYVQLRGLEKSQLADVIDIVSVQGKRILIMTKDEIYYSSLLDGTGKTDNWMAGSVKEDNVTDEPYFDFYDLGGATGKFSISSSIGHNKRAVVTGSLLYLLGSQGGVVSNQCNEDEFYPFSFRVIKDFEGIAHRHYAEAGTDKGRDFYVYSRAGMGRIEQENFIFDLDELGHELARDMAVYFKLTHCGETLYEEDCLPCEGERLASSCITHNVLEQYRAEESVTELDDYEKECVDLWSDPLLFEQSGSQSSHFKVTTTTRYIIVSHNSGKEVGDCDDVCLCYNRMFLYDRRLASSTMLHIPHKDALVVEDDFYIISDGILKKLVLSYDKSMPSLVYYKGLELHVDKWTQLTELNLEGKFQHPDEWLFKIPLFSVHTEESGHHYHDSMALYHWSRHAVKYGDIIRAKELDLVIPFAGYLSSIKLNYHR